MSVRPWKGVGPSFTRARNPQSRCPTCHDLALQRDEKEFQKVFVDIFELAESADEGDCRWCSLIYRALMQLGAELPAPNITSSARIVARPGKPWYVELPGQHGRTTVELYQTTGRDAIISALGFATDVVQRIDSDTVFNLMRDWIKTCDQTHSECARYPSSSPTRLLHVGDPEQPFEERNFRVVRCFRKPVKYVALSHCWGLEKNLTTTRSTQASRLESISWKDLPPSYQDSIKVCHNLGIQYIWIDSLCILQDDVSDWESESAKMSEIYEDAYLTIAIALAEGDHVGFLHRDTARERYTSQSLDLCDFGIGSDNIKIRPIHDHRTVDTYQPLTTRGWTLQESMISPRLLTFSVAVSFECRQANFCECGSGMYPDPFCADASIFKQASRSTYTRTLESVHDPEKIYDYWAIGIVSPYSDRKVTHLTDRLPALSALAFKFAQKLEDEYLAGLWQRDLDFGVNWETEALSLNATSRAPSWSWASVEGAVSFGNRVTDPSFTWTILDAKAEPSKGGLLHQGSLRITSWTCWAWLQIEWRNDPKVHPHFDCIYTLSRQDHGYKEHKISHDDQYKGPNMKLDTPVSATTVTQNNSRTFRCVKRSMANPQRIRAPVSGFVLCALLYELPSTKAENEAKRRFMLLGASPDTGRGAYQRVGMLTAGGKDIAWYQQLKQETIVIE